MKMLKKQNVSCILLLSLFSFLFLGTEFYFDNLIGGFTTESGVYQAQNLCLGVSVIGYVLYFLWTKSKQRISQTIGVVGVIVTSVGILFGLARMAFAGSYAGILQGGLISFLFLGFLGSSTCYYAVRHLSNIDYLGRMNGFAYALGIGFQFLNNNVVKNETAQLAVLGISLLLIFGLLHEEKLPSGRFIAGVERMSSPEEGEAEAKNTFRHFVFSKMTFVSLIVAVALMTCIFATLDAAVTIVHASGSYNIGQWPRLLLALSGLCAGFLFDLRHHRYMTPIMYLMTVVSVISTVILTMGGSFMVGLCIFYITAGFFVVFFMTSFMEVSLQSRLPALWAGLGRAVNNLVAVLFGMASVPLLEGDRMHIMIVSLVLLALISVACLMLMFEGRMSLGEIARKDTVAPGTKQENFPAGEEADSDTSGMNREAYLDSESRVSTFAKQYGLTPRETEVLEAILSTDNTVLSIASELGISRTALYRHIASINTKTDTKSRMGIVQLFYGQKEAD